MLWREGDIIINQVTPLSTLTFPSKASLSWTEWTKNRLNIPKGTEWTELDGIDQIGLYRLKHDVAMT